MDQDNRDHEIRAPAMQCTYEPTQRNAVIQCLQAVPCFSRGRHVDQREQYARYNLEHEACQGSAAENIEPARRLTRNGMRGSFANRRAQLQPQIEPLSDFLDQAHVVQRADRGSASRQL